MSFQMPSSRYILPSFVERTSYGMKESNPYNKLFEERIIFLGVQIDDASANDVMAQLLTLESTDPDRDITIYINSPGGSFTVADGHLRHDEVHPAGHPDRLHGPGRLGGRRPARGRHAGQAAGAALLPGADPPAVRRGRCGQVSDLEIHAAEIQRVRAQMEEILARHTGQTLEQVRTDIERDKILTAEEAKDYGIVDEVIQSRKLNALPAV